MYEVISEVIRHGFKFGDLATLAHVQLTPPLKKNGREKEREFPSNFFKGKGHPCTG